MCYSARIEADYRKYMHMFGAKLSLPEFVDVFWHRRNGAKVKIPKAMEAAFHDGATEDELSVEQAINEFNAELVAELEQDVFKQRKRLVDAEHALTVKATKAASESKRIATDKIDQRLRQLADIKRVDLKDRDSRIFPGYYAPVMVVEDGQRVVKPMRYQCRLQGKPANYDVRFPGTYNARRDNLEGFWRQQFGVSHGIMVVNRFYENVKQHRAEGRDLREGEAEKNVVIEFNPEPGGDMLVACLWSRWTGKGEPDLLSFAAITDDPPEEVVAAGHDRCIVPIKPEHVDAWLNPDRSNLAALYDMLDDRSRPYYEHRLAA